MDPNSQWVNAQDAQRRHDEPRSQVRSLARQSSNGSVYKRLSCHSAVFVVSADRIRGPVHKNISLVYQQQAESSTLTLPHPPSNGVRLRGQWHGQGPTPWYRARLAKLCCCCRFWLTV